MTTYQYPLEELLALLPLPPSDANKYTRGKLVGIVGSDRFPGAACLVARAAERMGAGYTEIVTAPAAVNLVRAASHSLVVRPWTTLHSTELEASKPNKPCAYVVGSGFDTSESKATFLSYRTLSLAQAPVLIDGGALDALATKKGRLILERRQIAGWPTVITPHAGEANRLAHALRISCDDPAELADKLAHVLGVITMLKGPHTFVSNAGRIVLVDQGTPALAKAGSGDVLAGMASSLLAQGLEALDACVLAATLQGRAGREAAKKLTSICVVADDIIDAIPQAIVSLSEDV